MVKRMAEASMTEHRQTSLPVPTVDRKDKRWVQDKYCRGDVWPAPIYQVASEFDAYDFNTFASDISDKTIANALKNGISLNDGLN